MIHLRIIAIGLVISGKYIGRNLGRDVGGNTGFFIATWVVMLTYITFVSSYAELTAPIPQAGGFRLPGFGNFCGLNTRLWQPDRFFVCYRWHIGKTVALVQSV